MMAGTVLVGFGLGATTAVPQSTVGFLFAFLAGGVVVNVLKEELPEERQSRFWPLTLGAACYAGLMLAA